jgi:hypothetical protein
MLHPMTQFRVLNPLISEVSAIGLLESCVFARFVNGILGLCDWSVGCLRRSEHDITGNLPHLKGESQAPRRSTSKALMLA